MSANTPAILTWGTQLCRDLNLAASRREFTYDFEMAPETPRAIIINFICSTLMEMLSVSDFDQERVVIVHKTIPQPGLNWHIDDCQLVSMKEPPAFKGDCYTKLADVIPGCNENKYLYFNPDTPTGRPARYTILFYSSTSGIDFQGADLVLADGKIIKPKKGHGIIMDTREAHMVTPVRNGIRKVSVVKIY